VPVSPNSFYAYLATIATGLKGMQVEARAGEILVELGRLQRDFERLAKVLETLGKHLHNADAQYQEAEKLTGRIDDHLKSLTESEGTALAEGEVAGSLPGGS
jgi:DNA recombination protein RmuC